MSSKDGIKFRVGCGAYIQDKEENLHNKDVIWYDRRKIYKPLTPRNTGANTRSWVDPIKPGCLVSVCKIDAMNFTSLGFVNVQILLYQREKRYKLYMNKNKIEKKLRLKKRLSHFFFKSLRELFYMSSLFITWINMSLNIFLSILGVKARFDLSKHSHGWPQTRASRIQPYSQILMLASMEW